MDQVSESDAEERIDRLEAALTSTRKQLWAALAERDAANARCIELEKDKVHPALAIDVQEHRQVAYQTGWDDGYAEGFGKATALTTGVGTAQKET